MHIRQQIREASATALQHQTAAGHAVFSSLVYPADDDDLPIIIIRIDEEESELVALGGRLQRTVNLIITAVAKESDERYLDDTLDSLAAEIEAIIGGNRFNGIAKQTVLVGTEFIRDTGNTAAGSIALTYAVLYHTDEQDGETAL